MMDIKEQISVWNQTFEHKTTEEVLAFFTGHFGRKIAFASSLGYEDQVITHMLASMDRSARIFTLDTGRLFPETYSLISRTNERYDIKIEIFFPDHEKVENMVNTKGINLFYDSIENRKECCHIRKLEPLGRAFKGLDAWISGLRREQSVTRSDMQLVEWDELNHLVKVNPLINWSEQQVKDYIHKEGIPYHVLHDKGFPSIGCQPCTRAIRPGEDIRAGRWWWENPDQKECGLHKR